MSLKRFTCLRGGHDSKGVSTPQGQHLGLVALRSPRTERLRDDWLGRLPAKHQAVLPCAHGPGAAMLPPAESWFPAVGLLVSTVGGTPALLLSNLLPCGKRARWPVARRESRGDWAGSWLMQNGAWEESRQMSPRWPNSDTSLAVTLCSLLLSILFPIVLPDDNLDAS